MDAMWRSPRAAVNRRWNRKGRIKQHGASRGRVPCATALYGSHGVLATEPLTGFGLAVTIAWRGQPGWPDKERGW